MSVLLFPSRHKRVVQSTEEDNINPRRDLETLCRGGRMSKECDERCFGSTSKQQSTLELLLHYYNGGGFGIKWTPLSTLA